MPSPHPSILARKGNGLFQPTALNSPKGICYSPPSRPYTRTPAPANYPEPLLRTLAPFIRSYICHHCNPFRGTIAGTLASLNADNSTQTAKDGCHKPIQDNPANIQQLIIIAANSTN